MIIKGIIFEDTVNYKKISMTIMMHKCDFKCDKECGQQVCQNLPIVNDPDMNIEFKQVLKDYYLSNPITEAIVFQGLEPFDTYQDLYLAIKIIREYTNDDIVIYTGYTEDEIISKVNNLRVFKNIIIKFGRYIPGQEPHFDPVIGVNLASDNQYGKIIG